MATRDGLAQIWYADANGVITGYTPTADNVASAIIDAYNEHFGTNINIWTPETKTLQVGGTVPNWNAYEKIELPNRFLWKYREMGGEGSVFGKVENDILICYAKSQGDVLIADENGLIISDTHVGGEFFEFMIKPRLNNLGITYTTISYDTSTYSENDNVKNWNDYNDIT